MGANSTQAKAVLLFLVAFVCIAVGLAGNMPWLLLILGIALLVGSVVLFRKCKVWEYEER